MRIRDKDTIKKEIISLLPHQPGVYRFFDSDGKIIYVGKAKDLKKRVSSYFVSENRLNAKTQVLVSKIADVKYTVVENEQDAFLLENNLIKENQPRYNILLKDSKTYPWICIKKEPFPRIFITRTLTRDGSLYFGPYSSAMYAHSLVDMFHSMFRLRTCSLKLNKEDISAGKFKECLNYHINKCCAPCIGKISEEAYNEMIEASKNILKGNLSQMIRLFREKMEEAASALEFEQAQAYKERMQMLSTHYNKSLIVQPSLTNLDVFSILFTDSIGKNAKKGSAFGNFFRVTNGCITRVLSLELKTQGDLSDQIPEEGGLQDSSADKGRKEVLTQFMLSVYNILSDADEKPSKEILVPFLPSSGILSEDHNIHVPQKGDKLSLLELSTKNAREFMLQALKQEALKNPEDKKNIGVEMLKRDLHLKEYPVHIECFDNSNIQGTNPVASCVVFRNGKPSKKDYRKFNIKTVVGANDFASMYEVVYRRYSRLMAEAPEDLPQLVVVDGGRGQLDFAYQALKDLGLDGKMPIIGIAKRLEELIRPGDPNPLFLDKNSPGLKTIMQLRDEAHRFGITFHRSLRSKQQVKSILREIKGVGEQTEKRLLMRFGSVPRIAAASQEDIAALVGPALAAKIKEVLSQ
ncbi:MAG: excinuclease ABC subunit C [Bacteroidales bacterium]|nr:excinuclease ABC subunit C [Bacteroidales bacterium]